MYTSLNMYLLLSVLLIYVYYYMFIPPYIHIQAMLNITSFGNLNRQFLSLLRSEQSGEEVREGERGRVIVCCTIARYTWILSYVIYVCSYTIYQSHIVYILYYCLLYKVLSFIQSTVFYTLYTIHYTPTVHHGRSPRVGGALGTRPQAPYPRPGLRCPVPRVYTAGHTSAPVPLLDHCKDSAGEP